MNHSQMLWLILQTQRVIDSKLDVIITKLCNAEEIAALTKELAESSANLKAALAVATPPTSP